MSYGAPSRERLELLRAELADVQDALRRHQKPDDRRVFEEMAIELGREIRRVERSLERQVGDRR